MRVRIMRVAAVALAASIALSGCAVKSKLDATLAPKPATVTVEATVAVVGASIEGTLATGFPDSLPMWPGAKVTRSKMTRTRRGTSSYSASLIAMDPFLDVVAGQGEGFKRAGWKVEATDASSASQKVSILMVSKPGMEGIVTVSQTATRPVDIEYVVTPKK